MKKIFRFLFLVFCLFTCTNPLLAQWVKTNLPDTLLINGFAVSPDGAGETNLFAGTSDGVFLTTDNGTSWTPVDSGLTSTDVVSLAVSGANLFAGTSGGVFLMTDNGTRWTPVDSGLANPGVLALAVSGSNIFAGTYSGVFLSSNSGTSWTSVNSGLANPSVVALAVSDSNIFAGTYNGVFLSSNSGRSWTAAGLTESVVHALAVSGSSVFAGTGGGGVFLWTNSGTNWTAVNAGLTFNGYIVYALAVSDNNIIAGTHGGVWRRPLSEMITAVKNTRNDVPMQFSVSQNYPNPFNPTTVINYQLAASSFVTLKVYDVLGREVATLVNGRQSKGYHNANFDGGRFASGVYLYRLNAVRPDGETFVAMKRMVLTK